MAWFQTHGRHDLPWREEATPYEVLVSEFMLQQTTVATIKPRFAAWMKLFPNLKTLANANESEVLSAWQGLGYYARARRLHAAAQAIVKEHSGKIPNDLHSLLKLPGIGPYTAGALQAFAFDQPAVVLDTNIFRVITRLHNITEPIDTVEGKKMVVESTTKMLPKKNGRVFAAALMDLGSMICTASDPKCDQCPLHQFCEAEEPATLPRKKPKPATTKKKEARAFYQKKNQIYLEQSTGPLWKGLWILPSCKITPKQKGLIASIVYPITRYRVTMNIYQPSGAIPKNLKPFKLTELDQLAIPSPHRKAINKVISTH